MEKNNPLVYGNIKMFLGVLFKMLITISQHLSQTICTGKLTSLLKPVFEKTPNCSKLKLHTMMFSQNFKGLNLIY